MRTKTLGGRRKRPRSATRPSLTATQDEHGASEYDTSRDNDDELRDVPIANCVDQHSNGSPLDVSNHKSIDSLEKDICICCTKGGGVLVCSERGCPVALHAKCFCSEPKFDDSGNFYCPYCCYKRAVDERRELKRKAMIAKKALSSFLDKDVVTSDELAQEAEAAKRKEPHDGDDGISLGGENGLGTDGANIQPLRPEGDQPRKLQEADSDRCEIAVEDQADGDGDFRPCREEEMPVGINLVQDSMNQEKLDEPNKTETDAVRVLELKESFETEDSRRNMEDVHVITDEVDKEAEPLTALHLGKRTDGRSLGIAFAKGTQQSVVKSSEKGRMTDKGKVPDREKRVSATGSSVSETNDSDSEVISGRKRHRKRKVQETAYPQSVASVRKSLLKDHKNKGENASDMNGEVTSSRSRRKSQSLPKRVNNWTSLIRRKKLLWTAEEEKALQDGVLRFSKENQHIPWRRILDSGHHIFDKTRTPVDLKDKWRNMNSGSK